MSQHRSSNQGPVEGPATLAVGGRLVEGTVQAADPTLGLFLFIVDEVEEDEDMLPEEGDGVRIRWQGAAGFAAEADVVEVEDGDRWVLSVPVEMDPSRTRQSKRLQADGAWTFRMEDGTVVDVHDLSTRGLGVAFPVGTGAARTGDPISGTLVGDTAGEWSVVLQTNNVRAHPDDDTLWIVGGKVSHDDEEAAARLAAIVMSMM